VEVDAMHDSREHTDRRHTDWRRAQRCGSNACVEVSQHGITTYMRDSADPDGPVLTFTRSAWEGFLADLGRA
jgi:hypothetical protein